MKEGQKTRCGKENECGEELEPNIRTSKTTVMGWKRKGEKKGEKKGKEDHQAISDDREGYFGAWGLGGEVVCDVRLKYCGRGEIFCFFLLSFLLGFVAVIRTELVGSWDAR